MTTPYPGHKRLSEGDATALHTHLNTYLRDAQEFFALAPSVRVGDATNPSVTASDNTWTQITGFDTERWDADSMWTSPDTDITFQKAGIYLVSATAAFAGNTAGRRGLRLRHSNLTVFAEALWEAPASALETPLTIASIYAFDAGDRCQLWTYQDSGGNLNVVGGQTYTPELAGVWLAGVGEAEPWTDPYTWVDSGDETDHVTAWLLDGQNAANHQALYGRPCARVHSANGTQSIPSGSGTETGLLCDAVNFDSWRLHDTAKGYSRFIAAQDGIYATGAIITGFSGSLGGARRSQIKKTAAADGAVTIVARDVSAGQTNDGTPKDLGSLAPSGLCHLLEGDTLHVTLTHDAGSNINLARNDKASPSFWIAQIGGAA